MKKILTVLMSAFFLLGCLSPMAVVAAGEEGPTVYFEETFGSAVTTSEDYVAPQDLATSTTVGYNGWTINTTDYASVKAQGVTMSIIADPDDETNNILHCHRETSGSGNSTHQLISSVSVPAQPASDTVVFSFKMKFDNRYHKAGFDGQPTASLRNDFVTFGSATFTPVGTEQTSAVSATNTWHTYELVISYTTNTTTLYIDTYQIGDVYNGTMPVSSIKIYQPRGETYGYGNVWFDDFKVEWIPDPEFLTSFAEFVPATKGGLYVDGNLPETFELLGESYDVTYESSDLGIIAANGTVTRPDFFSTVSVTPVTTFEGETVKGKTSALVVLPKNGTVRLFEDFEIAGATHGRRFFGTTGTDGLNGWFTPSGAGSVSYYEEKGNKADFYSDNGNMTLNLYKEGSSSGRDYDIRKNLSEAGTSSDGRLVTIMRIKKLGDAGAVNIASPYIGMRANNGVWYGDYIENRENGYTISAMSDTDNWHTYMFVYDTSKSKTTGVGESYPISVYVDGSYIGTGFSGIDRNAGEIPANQFTFRQFCGSTGGTNNILIDDIMFFQANSGDVQFGPHTIANSKLTGAKVQHNSYGAEAVSGTVFAAAYSADDVMVDACPGVVVTAAATGGYADATFDLDLSGASYFRLFFFDSEADLQPIIGSKTIPVQ